MDGQFSREINLAGMVSKLVRYWMVDLQNVLFKVKATHFKCFKLDAHTKEKNS